MAELLASFIQDERASATTEYSHIAALISIAILTSALALHGALDNTYSGIASEAF